MRDNDLRSLAREAGLSSLGSYGSGDFWVSCDHGGGVQTNWYASVEEAAVCYRRWKNMPGRVWAHHAVEEAS